MVEMRCFRRVNIFHVISIIQFMNSFLVKGDVDFFGTHPFYFEVYDDRQNYAENERDVNLGNEDDLQEG